MLENFEQKHERKRAIIAMLIELAKVDKKISKIEDRFILDVANQLMIPPEEVELIAAHPDQYTLKPPPEEQERMTILYYLLFTMRIDGQIHEKEENLCYKAGLRLGFNPQLTRDLIRVMKTYLTEEIPPEAMLNEIKKYLN